MITKSIEILTNGSINFSQSNIFDYKKVKIHKKDNKNFELTLKVKIVLKTHSKLSGFYKKRYNL